MFQSDLQDKVCVLEERIARLVAEVKAWREHAAIRYMGKTQYDGDQFTAIRKTSAAVDAAKDLEDTCS